MKRLTVLTLFLCLGFSSAGVADSDVMNWCGTYFEDDGRGYIRLALTDLNTGSEDCSMEAYNNRINTTGQTRLGLDFARNRSTVNKWRKFDNHLIEVRGKIRNGYINNPRLIRDRGV